MHIYEFWLVNVPMWLRINRIFTYFHILNWCEMKISNWLYFSILLIELNGKWNKWTEHVYPNGMANWKAQTNDRINECETKNQMISFHLASDKRTIIFLRWQKIWNANGGRRENFEFAFIIVISFEMKIFIFSIETSNR